MTAIPLEIPVNKDDLLGLTEADVDANRAITTLLNSNVNRTIDVRRFVTNKPAELTYDELIQVARGPETRKVNLPNGEETFEMKGFSGNWIATYYPSNRLPKTNPNGQYSSKSKFVTSNGEVAPNWGRTGRRHLLYDAVQWAIKEYGVKGWINISRLCVEVAHLGFSPGYLYAMIRDLELKTHSTILYVDETVSYREQIRRMVQKYSDTSHGPPGISNSEIRNVGNIQPPASWNEALRSQGTPGAAVGGPGRGRRLEDRSLRESNIRSGQTKRMKRSPTKRLIKTITKEDIADRDVGNGSGSVENTAPPSPPSRPIDLSQLKVLLRLSEAMEDIFMIEGTTDIHPLVIQEAIDIGRSSAEEKLKNRAFKGS